MYFMWDQPVCVYGPYDHSGERCSPAAAGRVGRTREELAQATVDGIDAVVDRLLHPTLAPPAGDAYRAGLGLSLTRWIAEAHGGSVRAQNVVGGGAQFVLEV